MANFKSKDLTISIPEKGTADPAGPCTCNTNIQQTNALNVNILPTITIHFCTVVTHFNCTGTVYCFTLTHTVCHNFTCAGYTIQPTPTACTTTWQNPCGVSFEPTSPIFEQGNEISSVTDLDMLNTLKEKILETLKEVEKRQRAISK